MLLNFLLGLSQIVGHILVANIYTFLLISTLIAFKLILIVIVKAIAYFIIELVLTNIAFIIAFTCAA